MNMFRKLRGSVLLIGALAFLLAACGGQKDPITGLVLNKESLELTVGETAQLKAALEYKSGKTIVAEVGVTWGSSDDEKATVDSSGKVTAVAAGEATVTATHSSGKTASVEVTVTDEAGTGEEPSEGDKPGETDKPGDGDKPGEGDKPGDGGGPGEDPGNGEEPGNGEHPEAPQVTVSIRADAVELYIGESTLVSAVVSGTENQNVTWRVEPEGALKIEDDGAEITVVAQVAASPARIIAMSVDESEAEGEAEIVILPLPDFNPAKVFVGGTRRLETAAVGTELNPFLTISAALESGLEGDAEIHVAAGTYEEPRTIQLANQQLQGAGSHNTAITVSGPNCTGISINRGNRATVSGIHLDVSGLDGKPPCEWVRGIHLVETANASLKDVVVTGAESTDPKRNLEGISLWKTTNTLIEDVTVEHTQRSGIGVNGGSNLVLRNITVSNAGQGEGTSIDIDGITLPSPLQSGFGALGFFANNATGSLSNLLLDGDFFIDDMNQRLALNIHLEENQSAGIDLGENFSWTARDTEIPLLLQLNVPALASLPGGGEPQLTSASGYAVLAEKLGITHALLGETMALLFSSEERAVEYTRSAMDVIPATVPLFELDTNPTGLPTGSVAFRNVLAVQSTSGATSQLQDLVNLVASAPVLFSEGVLLTEGIYEQQVDIGVSMHFKGAAGYDVTLRAPEGMPFVSDTNGNEYFAILRVGDTVNDRPIEVVLADFELDASMPQVLPATSTDNRESCEQKFTSGLTIIHGAVVEATDVQVINVGDRGHGQYCDWSHGVVVGLSFDNLNLSAGPGTLRGERLDIFMAPSGKYALSVRHADSHLELRSSQVFGAPNGETAVREPGQNGIQFAFGSGLLDGVTVRDFRYAPSKAATALLISTEQVVTVHNSQFVDNNSAVRFDEDASEADFEYVDFVGNTWDVIADSTGYFDLSDRGNTFDGISPSITSPVAELFNVERKVVHRVDSDGYPGRIRVVPNNWYVSQSADLQGTIGISSGTDTINLEPEADYTGITSPLELNVENLTIVGNKATVGTANVRADGMNLHNMTFHSPATTSQRRAVVEVHDSSDLRLTDVHVRADGAEDSWGVHFVVSPGADFSGFSMVGGSVTDAWIGINVGQRADDPIQFSGIEIRDVHFADLPFKALYFEALADAELAGLSITDSGNTGNYAAAGYGKLGSAIDINLKHGQYGNIALRDIEIVDSGYSNGDPTGAAVGIKARDDGNQGGSLSNVTVDHLKVSFPSGNFAADGLRIGEPSRNNSGPVGVSVSNSVLYGGNYGIANYTAPSNRVDATRNNELIGGEQPTRGAVDR